MEKVHNDKNNCKISLSLSLSNFQPQLLKQFFLLFVDFNECAAGENDCSQWALCSNTWASYTCACLDGFVDNNPERGGRVCLGRNLWFDIKERKKRKNIYCIYCTCNYSVLFL